MASSFSLKVHGLDALTKKIHTLPQVITDDLDRAFQEAAQAWENGAVRDAPVYDGKLRGSIRSARKGVLWYSVSANVFYAPYIEFGTKKKARIPSDLQGIAAEFKGGKGGSFKDLLAAIEKWVRKNGIKEVSGKKAAAVRSKGRYKRVKRRAGTYSAAAYWIALNIAKNGIKPHPYFFKQKQTAVNIISREVTNIYKKIQNG